MNIMFGWPRFFNTKYGFNFLTCQFELDKFIAVADDNIKYRFVFELILLNFRIIKVRVEKRRK